MLATRQIDSDRNHWPTSRFLANLTKTHLSSRMSDSFGAPLPTQLGWQGSYPSPLPSGNHGIFNNSYGHTGSHSGVPGPPGQQISATAAGSFDVHRKDDRGVLTSPPARMPGAQVQYLTQPHSPIACERERGNTGAVYAQVQIDTSPMTSSRMDTDPLDNDDRSDSKEDEEELLEDDDMLDADGDHSDQPKTAAERMAARRKMKRFRLTHQQTRFLMSEFAKQPHPEAAHRDRLSREIPGLSPRQVQVWFQNRRAKMKRMSVDDRDRMLDMRRVPDDFDNVRALHSPYGAVRNHGTPLQSPARFNPSAFAAEHMMRPLMIDVPRAEGGSHTSSPSLTPAFPNIGFNPSAPMAGPGMLSPASSSSPDRYGYSNHLSPPIALFPRTPNPFGRQDSLDTAPPPLASRYQASNIRPLQPLYLRESASKSRADLQSPLRCNMAWKGDAIDYTNYPGADHGRHPSAYETPEDLSGSSAPQHADLDSAGFPSSGLQSPGNEMPYPGYPHPSGMHAAQRVPRFRAVSASLPLGLDLQSNYLSRKAASVPQHLPGIASSAAPPLNNNTGYPSAPLTAPMDFSSLASSSSSSSPPPPPLSSRGLGAGRASPPAQDYQPAQMSAPIAPPHDFSRAFQASIGPDRGQGGR